MVIPLEGHLQICRGEERRGEGKRGEGKRVRGEERENYLPYFLTYLTERFASPDRQTDRQTSLGYRKRVGERERMRRSISLQKECLPSIYIYIFNRQKMQDI